MMSNIPVILDLQNLTYSGHQAFEINLHNSCVLQIESIVRRLPNRRLVCRGIWNNQAVFAKIFIGNDAKKYALRDKRGAEYLLQAAVLTPSLLYANVTQDGAAEVLIYQAIENSENAEVLYLNQLNQAERYKTSTKIVQAVAGHHNVNLMQTDLHLKNFLIKDSLTYTLDGDGVRRYKKLNKQQALKNLSVLLSKFDVLDMEGWYVNLLKAYAAIRVWEVIPDAATIKSLVNQYRKKVVSHYAENKVFRACTDVRIDQQDNYFSAISTCFFLKNLPKSPQDCDALIASQLRIKSGNTCTVALTKIDGIAVVIKRYNVKSFWHGVNRAMRQTRAAVSWGNAHRLKQLGVATAAPIALIEERHFRFSHFGLKGKAYFLSEYLDAPDVSEFFSKVADVASQEDAIANIARLFYRLYLLKISHGDMKANNVKMIHNMPYLIDLDSMKQHQITWIALNAHVKDLRRFMQNWQEAPALYNALIQALKAVYTDNQPLQLAQLFKKL